MKNRTLIDAKPEHYGKFVVVKSFNDNTVVAYGDTPEDAQQDAESKGYKIVGHRDDPVPPNVLLYCYAPCEGMIGITTTVNMTMVNDGCSKCPKCKYRS